MGAVLQDQQTPLQPAVNIPGYEIGVLDKQLKVSLSLVWFHGTNRLHCTAGVLAWVRLRGSL